MLQTRPVCEKRKSLPESIYGLHQIEHEVVDALDRASMQQDAYCCRLYSIFVLTPLGELSSKDDSDGTKVLAGRKPLPLSDSIGRGGSSYLSLPINLPHPPLISCRCRENNQPNAILRCGIHWGVDRYNRTY